MVDYLALEVDQLIHATFHYILHKLVELRSDDAGLIHDPANRSLSTA